MILHLIFRLGIWFLLTADLSPANIMIGIAIAFIIPHPKIQAKDIKQWLEVGKNFIIAIPKAFIEAIEIMIFPHQYESLTIEKVEEKRPPILIFLDIFLITFTPKTIVLKYQEAGYYQVHKISRRQENESHFDRDDS
jgi:multicomponent Na+:H+ antiporter subunit E